jgi:hypothetical protein
VGDEVTLLAPTRLGESPADGTRRMGRAWVRSRTANRAVLDVSEGPGAEELERLCVAALDGVRTAYLTGCEAGSNRSLQVLSESQAYRFPAAVMWGVLLAALYLLGVAFAGRVAALLAVAMMCFLPEPFFHAHLTCFDVPIAAVGLATLYAFHRSLRSRGWAVATGFIWGLAVLTKHNAFMLPVALLGWWLVAGIPDVRRVGPRSWSLPAFPLAFLMMPLIGVPMLFLLWPSLWHDPIASFGKYLAFHLHHDHYFQYYFGAAYQVPPFPREYAFVKTLLTVPVLVTVLFAAGKVLLFVAPAVTWLRSGRPAFPQGTALESYWGRALFLAVNMAQPIAIFALGSTPIFGGSKHWMLTMPFYCLLAAVALVEALRMGWRGATGLGVPDRPWLATAAAGLVASVVLLPGVDATLRYREVALGYYNELVGGLRGAADARMQRQFWSYASRGALDYVNRTAPEGIAVDFQDALTTGCEMYRREGMLRQDLGCASRRGSPDLLLFDVEERFSEEEIRDWASMDTLGPVYEVEVEGVPMVRVYRKHAGLAAMEHATRSREAE